MAGLRPPIGPYPARDGHPNTEHRGMTTCPQSAPGRRNRGSAHHLSDADREDDVYVEWDRRGRTEAKELGLSGRRHSEWPWIGRNAGRTLASIGLRWRSFFRSRP